MGARRKDDLYEQGDEAEEERTTKSDVDDQEREAAILRSRRLARLPATADVLDDLELAAAASARPERGGAVQELKQAACAGKHPELRPCVKLIAQQLVRIRQAPALRVIRSKSFEETLDPATRNYAEVCVGLYKAWLETSLFYLYLKSVHADVSAHPVLSRLYELAQLIKELQPFERSLHGLVRPSSSGGAGEVLRDLFCGDRGRRTVSVDGGRGSGATRSRYAAPGRSDAAEAPRAGAPPRLGAAQASESELTPERLSRKDRVESILKARTAAALAELSSVPEQKLRKRLKAEREPQRRLETPEAFVRQAALESRLADVDDSGFADPILGAAAATTKSPSRKALSVLREDIGRAKRALQPLQSQPDGNVTAKRSKRDVTSVRKSLFPDEEDAAEMAAGICDDGGSLGPHRETVQQPSRQSRPQTGKTAPTAPIEPLAQDGKRKISSNILRNRGLTRQRKKVEGNARVHNRLRYKKKLKSLTGTQRGASGGVYEGETTIRDNVTRSRKLG